MQLRISDRSWTFMFPGSFNSIWLSMSYCMQEEQVGKKVFGLLVVVRGFHTVVT